MQPRAETSFPRRDIFGVPRRNRVRSGQSHWAPSSSPAPGPNKAVPRAVFAACTQRVNASACARSAGGVGVWPDPPHIPFAGAVGWDKDGRGGTFPGYKSGAGRALSSPCSLRGGLASPPPPVRFGSGSSGSSGVPVRG